MKNLNAIEDYIWFYYKQGLSIIPLGKNETNNLKAPSLKSWDKYKTERASEEEIKQWIKDGLFVGIGIIGGAVSGNLAIIDFDEKGIPDEIGIKLNKTVDSGHWVAETGKGWHIYCRGLTPVRTRKAAIVSMDLKADKGYVVAPPSMHESGKKYQWLNDKLEDIPKIKVMKMFDEIVTKIKDVRNIKPVKAKKGKDTSTPQCITIMKNGAERGRRNETLYALANYYKHIKNYENDDILSVLSKWNAKLKSPLSDSELETTFKSALEADYQTGCSSIRDLGYCPYDDETQCPFRTGHTEADILLDKYNVINKSKVSYTNLAKLINNEYDFNFLVVRDESTDKKSIYAWKDGYYDRNGRDVIRKLVVKYLDDRATEKSKDEVIGAITDMTDGIDRSEVEPSKKYINVENGILDFKKGKLIEHDSKFKFVQKIPVNFNPNAKCPAILKFLREVIKEKDMPVVQEMFGYCLYRGYPVSAAFILHGTGRNGKSVLLKLLRSMTGRSNISSRKLHEITDDVFAKADLYGKMVNVCGEMDTGVLKQTGNLKELTGEDYVTAQRKYHGAFQFTNYAKLIFSTNTVPKCTDSTFGFYDRLRIIQFTKIFNSDNPKTDVHLFDNKLNTKEELEGLLVWSIEGLKRLLKENKISGQSTLENMGQNYDDAVNYVFNWMEDNIRIGADNDALKLPEVFEQFNRWCKSKDKPRVALLQFSKQFRGFARQKGVYGKRIQFNGSRTTVYKRLTWIIDGTEDVVENDGMGDEMKEIQEMTPCKLKTLEERFGKKQIKELMDDKILIKNDEGKLVLDV